MAGLEPATLWAVPITLYQLSYIDLSGGRDTMASLCAYTRLITQPCSSLHTLAALRFSR